MLDSARLDTLECRLQCWAAHRLSCAPADRETAEEGIRLAYLAANLPPPQRIVWSGGPVEIAERLAAIAAGDQVGANVKAVVFDDALSRVATFAEIFWKEIVVAAGRLSNKRPNGTRNPIEKANRISSSITRNVDEAARQIFFRPSVKTRHAMRRWRGLPPLLPSANFSEIAIGPNDIASLGVYEYLYDVAGWKDETERLRGLWAIAKSASWIVPHERVCWIAERPDTLCIDAQGRLHCVDGPALRYRDGWSVYAWKGVETPAWMIKHPERITPSRISETFEPALRNAMIDIMTPERFIATGDPKRVSRDETGVLWKSNWYHRGVTIGSWCAVEVVNGTPEPGGCYRHYILRVPAHFRTAREAVAWTYGLTAEQYTGLEVRT